MGKKQQATSSQASQSDTSTSGASPQRSSVSSRGNAFAQEQIASRTTGVSAQEDLACTADYAAPSAVTVTGQPDFYDNRHGDFEARYGPTGCGLVPPDYYLNYGGKYCTRFTTQLRPKLSANGQAWLDQTALNLQRGIEDKRLADPMAFDQLERNNAAFLEFAYGTHADAYLNAGLGELDPIDLAMIGLTPDIGDLVTVPGISQAIESAIRILPRWGDNLDLLTTEQAVVVDGWLRSGRGTIEEVTAFAYDLAAEQLQPTVVEIDATFGEGTTERVLNEARELTQDGVQTIAEPIRALMDEAEFQWPWESQ